jgi:hypothetical protein
MFPSSGEGGKTATQLGPLERANLNHWALIVVTQATVSKVVKPWNTEAEGAMALKAVTRRLLKT